MLLVCICVVVAMVAVVATLDYTAYDCNIVDATGIVNRANAAQAVWQRLSVCLPISLLDNPSVCLSVCLPDADVE
jgi:hypothetical protein